MLENDHKSNKGISTKVNYSVWDAARMNGWMNGDYHRDLTVTRLIPRTSARLFNSL